jgi:hypothetical protein
MMATTQDTQDAFSALSDALSKKGVTIAPQELEALHALSDSTEGLGLSIDTTLNIPISDGSGSYSVSYPTAWMTIHATLTIAAPQNADQWQMVARDTYNDKTLWSGIATYNTPISVTYKTGFKINLQVTTHNQSEPYTGTLSVRAQISL